VVGVVNGSGVLEAPFINALNMIWDFLHTLEHLPEAPALIERFFEGGVIRPLHNRLTFITKDKVEEVLASAPLEEPLKVFEELMFFVESHGRWS